MKLQSIFVGKLKEVTFQGKKVATSIFKYQVKGQVRVHDTYLEGDKQADLTVHGGVDKAVYAYPLEHYEFWKSERPDLNFEAGVFGENLSVTDMNEEDVCIGDIYQIGTSQFSVTSPRMPCFKLGIKMNDPGFVKEFMQARRTGFYFKVLEEGSIQSGDTIEKLSVDGHGLTINDVVLLYSTERKNKELLQKAISAASLPDDWREFFVKRINELK